MGRNGAREREEEGGKIAQKDIKREKNRQEKRKERIITSGPSAVSNVLTFFFLLKWVAN